MKKFEAVYLELDARAEKLKRELEAAQKDRENIRKVGVSLLKNDGWLTWKELTDLYEDKRDIKVWVEEVDDLGRYLKLKLVCVEGDEAFKGCVIYYTTLKNNKTLLRSRYKATEVFNIHLLKLQNDLRDKFEEKEFGGMALYKKPKEFHVHVLYTEKPGRRW